MNSITRNTILYRVVVSCLIVGLVGWLGYQYIEQTFAELRDSIEQQLADGEQRVVGWYQNPTDIPASDSLHKNRLECSSSERIDYESVLQNLGTGLPQSDLVYLLAQFDRCGTKIAQRYHQVLTLTELELRSREQLIVQLEAIPGSETEIYSENILNWQEYIESLARYVELQINLDELQRSLIVARLNQESVDGEEITGLLDAVANLRAHLSEQKQVVDSRFAAVGL